jgi:hypothetical protein
MNKSNLTMPKQEERQRFVSLDEQMTLESLNIATDLVHTWHFLENSLRRAEGYVESLCAKLIREHVLCVIEESKVLENINILRKHREHSDILPTENQMGSLMLMISQLKDNTALSLFQRGLDPEEADNIVSTMWELANLVADNYKEKQQLVK